MIARQPHADPSEVVRVPSDVAMAVRLAYWLDERYVDPILGLVLPFAGDILTTVVGLYAVVVAVRRRMPAIVVARMLKNLAVDLVIGAIPLFGDAFDFVYKAHRRNADLLLERHVLGPSPVKDWAAVVLPVSILLVALALPFLALFLLVFRR